MRRMISHANQMDACMGNGERRKLIIKATARFAFIEPISSIYVWYMVVLYGLNSSKNNDDYDNIN